MAAALVALGFPPFGLWPLTWVGFALFAVPLFKLGAGSFASEESQKLIRASARWFGIFIFSTTLFGFYWIAYTLHEFGNLPWIVAALVTLLIFAVSSLYSVFMGYVWGKITLEWLPKRSIRPTLPQLFFLFFVWLVSWDAFDFRIFPWNPAMSVGSDKFLLASVYTLKDWGWRLIFCIWVAGAAKLWMECQRVARPKQFWLREGVVTLFVFVGAYVAGYAAYRDLNLKYSQRQPVTLLQGNVGNYEKKLVKLNVMPTVRAVLQIHKQLVEQIPKSAATSGPVPERWVFWPETSFPGFPIEDPQAKFLLQDWAAQTGGLHMVGAYENAPQMFAGEETRLDFNVVALFHEKSGLVKHYRKRIRVPFGEYIPFDEYFPGLYKLLPAVNHFGKGDDFVPLAHPDPKGPVFIPFVCYEVLLHSYVDESLKVAREKYPGRPLIFVNPTNDSWYGPTSEPFQHSLLARWSMVQHGIPALRPTNTGLSQVIAPWGEVLSVGARDESLIVNGALPVESVQMRLNP